MRGGREAGILAGVHALARKREKELHGKVRWRCVVRFALAAMLLAVCQTAGCGQYAPPAAEKVRQPGELEVQSAAERYDLGRDEGLGGHTLERHIGLSDAQLEERLRRERHITAASTWTDRATAETTVAETLRAERGRIESWMRRGARRANLALHYDAGRVIGRSLHRGESRVVDCTRAVIVLRADGPDGFYVLTAYPEDRE